MSEEKNSLWDKTKDLAEDAVEAAQGAAGNAREAVGDAAESATEMAKGAASSAMGAAGEAVDGARDKVAGAAGATWAKAGDVDRDGKCQTSIHTTAVRFSWLM